MCLSESLRYAHLFMHTHRMTIKPVRLAEELEDAVAASPPVHHRRGMLLCQTETERQREKENEKGRDGEKEMQRERG